MIPANNEIRLEPTTLCNYNCVMCNSPRLSRERDIMDIEFFKWLLGKVLGETDQYDTIAWAGIGEPLLNPYIVEMTQIASDEGLKVLLVTNGRLLYPELFLDLQKAGLYSVRVSFHGANPQEYAAMHGRSEGDFHATLQNVQNVAVKKTTCKLLLTWAQADGINDGDMPEWLQMFDGKADLLEIWKAHNWAGSMGFREEQEEKLKTCGRFHRGPLQIQVDGTLVPCCFDWDGEMEFGDIKIESLASAFSSPKFLAMRALHETGDFVGSDLPCLHCDQRNKCRDGVMVYTSADIDKVERAKLTSTGYTKTVEG